VVVTASGQEQRKRELGNAVGTINVAEVQLASVNSASALLQGRVRRASRASLGGGTTGDGRAHADPRLEQRVAVERAAAHRGRRAREQHARRRCRSATGGQSRRAWTTSTRRHREHRDPEGPAAAALYGTAAANGVIQITTRRGRSGPARWSMYTEQGRLHDRTDYPTSYTATVNAGGSGPGRRCVVFDIAMGTCSSIVGREEFNPLRDPATQPFRTGTRQQYGVGLSGGGEQVTYYMGMDWEGEKGVLRPSRITATDPNELDRLNLRLNVQSRPNDRTEIGLRTGFMTSDLSLPANDNHLLGIHLNGLLGTGNADVNGGFYNIDSADKMLANYLRQEAKRFTTAANATFRPIDWLTLTGTAGIDQLQRHDNQLMPSNVITEFTQTYLEGFRSSNRVETTNLTSTVNAAATFQLMDALLSTTSVGGQYHREEYHDTRGYGQGLAPGTKSLSGASRLFSTSENNSEVATVGAFAQQMFGWNDRVFITGCRCAATTTVRSARTIGFV
jgi:TonB-dependent starch-binding outer membrane protein SusC